MMREDQQNALCDAIKAFEESRSIVDSPGVVIDSRSVIWCFRSESFILRGKTALLHKH